MDHNNMVMNSTSFNQTTDYTYSYSKYSCVKQMFLPHIILSYVIMLSGLMCFITRFFFISTHSWFGRIYILSMLWNIAFSLLIHNTGLPLGVLISFIWVLGGLTLGWIFIILHKDLRPKYKGIFSLRNLHGILMFMSWINITGRIFASNITQDFHCETYPFNKITNQFVPIIDPNESRLPWYNKELQWGIILSIGPITIGLLFSWLYQFITERKEKLTPIDL